MFWLTWSLTFVASYESTSLRPPRPSNPLVIWLPPPLSFAKRSIIWGSVFTSNLPLLIRVILSRAGAGVSVPSIPSAFSIVPCFLFHAFHLVRLSCDCVITGWRGYRLGARWVGVMTEDKPEEGRIAGA